VKGLKESRRSVVERSNDPAREKWTFSCTPEGMLSAVFPAFTSVFPVPSNDDIAAKLLHFGADDCNRLLVLRSVGYAVELCPTVEEFHPALQKRPDADAVLFRATSERESCQAVRLAREHSNAPLVLFNTCYAYADEDQFELVIPPLTRPEEWLREIAGVIKQKPNLREPQSNQ
jgi:hypothetical protein